MPFVPPFDALPQLSDSQFDAYAHRIGLDPAALRAAEKSAPSADTLFKISVAHQLHVPDNALDADAPIEFMSGDGMPESFDDWFEQAIMRRRGGYCYVLNGLCAAFLRYLGYQVADMATRANQAFHTAETLWTIATHIVLFVTIDEQTWLFDVGFAAGSSVKPVPLESASWTESLSPTELFVLRKEPCPGLDSFGPQIPGWTLYRRLSGRTDGKPPLVSAVYHVQPVQLLPMDVAGLVYILNGRRGLAEKRPHQKRILVNMLLPNGDRRNIIYNEGDEQVRYYQRSGVMGQIVEDEHFPPTNRSLYNLMRSRFGCFE